MADTAAVPRWPGEARAACAFTFDLDAETLWMARGVSEPVTLSQGRFGPVEAVPRILELLEKAQVRASFFIPAWTAAHYPDTVRAIAAAGPRDRLSRRRARARLRPGGEVRRRRFSSRASRR